jgi:CsoR family transcriptional regulator, copper-sensing transcriptional repressor
MVTQIRLLTNNTHTCTIGIGMECCKQKKLIGLKKAVSLAQKVQKMIEEDKYCIDIIQQVEAINGLIKGVKNELLKCHMETCFTKGMESSSETKNKK